MPLPPALPCLHDPGPRWAVRFVQEVARQPRGHLHFTLAVTAVVVLALGALAATARQSRSGARLPAPAGAAAAVPEAPAPLVAPAPGDRAGYEAAAQRAAAEVCPGLPPPVLTAIAEVESGYGRHTRTSSRGARGPMQFLPATFQAYATDGDGDGSASLHDPVDAVYTAARYLCANGAHDGRLSDALWNYNRSRSYVNRVLHAAGLS